jgi:hypothetical protein
MSELENQNAQLKAKAGKSFVIKISHKEGEDSELLLEREIILDAVTIAFQNAFHGSAAKNERARVIANSRSARYEGARRLYYLVNLAAVRERPPLDKMKCAHLAVKLLHEAVAASPPNAHRIEAFDLEKSIGRALIEMMTGPDPSQNIRALADLAECFPVTSELMFDDNSMCGPPWFKPTLQDGLKEVMLGAFFDLMRGFADGQRFPTIGELYRAIREKWNWHGDDKELRNARRELGLSGLPRGKAGRGKNRGGKSKGKNPRGF